MLGKIPVSVRTSSDIRRFNQRKNAHEWVQMGRWKHSATGALTKYILGQFLRSYNTQRQFEILANNISLR